VRLAVTGRNGQVVQSLVERAAAHPGLVVVAVGRPNLELAEPASIGPALEAARPDIVVSSAAYTAVDRAEDEPDLACAVNEAGARYVAQAAAVLGVTVIHLSTDYVFSGEGVGEGDRPWREDDETAPKSVYGASKLAGERAVAEANPRHLILRTAWVYSPFGSNFVKTMLRVAKARTEIAVVADQWGNPTSALDIADGIIHAAAMLHRDENFSPWGTYHLAGTGTTNWSGFARHILATSKAHGGPYAAVRDIATADYPTRAERPKNSRLSSGKFGKIFGWTAPDWRVSTEQIVARLVKGGQEASER
jgi:dTDP-4-dehydrorhamnose reductase